MTRLTYTPGGLKRRMQVSTKPTVFLFVEGKEIDPWFYGEICEQVFSEAQVGYEIMGAWWLADPGGKEALIGFYDYLAVTNSLVMDFHGNRSATIFFLDKDIDDVLHRKRYSDHIVYTEHYAVENYLFAEADLARASSSASSIERRAFAASLGDGRAWCRRGAEAWRDWVVFCIFTQKHDVRCPYNYRLAASTINDPLDEPAPPAVVQQHKEALQDRSGMPPAQFEKAYRAVARLVDDCYRRDNHQRLFKGKWYVGLLQAQIDRVAAGRPHTSHALSNRIWSAVEMTLDFSEDWAEHFRAPLRALVARF
jgi:hypothetical protein